jgi:tetratricopeptide (TPR) repeat protein
VSAFRKFFFLAALAALAVAVVLACGPFFGIEVLTNRKEVLLAAPSISFQRELAALAPPPKDKLPVVEANDNGDVVYRQSVEAKEPPDVLASPAATQYAQGADSFHRGDNASAKVHFQAVLAMPDDTNKKSRELWAHFMLGRVAADMGDAAEARQQFQATRALVRQGMPDPLGLAVASFGEEALLDWKAGDIAAAVDLYAQQAAYGSKTAQNSLITIAGLILKDDALLDKAIVDATARRLIFICLNQNNGAPFFIGFDTDEYGERKSGPGAVDRTVSAMERHQLTNVQGAGLLASAAYYAGRPDLAEKLAAWEDAPISDWVKAKVALQRGNQQAALPAFEKALKGFSAAGAATQTANQLGSELGVLRVSRGDYVQALDLFRQASGQNENGMGDYWGDAAYLAERVLTLDELQKYVDARVQSPKPKQGSTDSRLRNLLARRLMRAGRRKEAFPYFTEAPDRTAAQQYAEALDKAASFWRWPGTRAEAWFTAALLARAKGMELLGFERSPDYAMWDGEFDGGFTEPKHASDAYQTEDERKRAAASRAPREVRFQYRLTAVDHATASADLLPHSSQAFAAVLCEASTWVIDREPERARQVYQRYLHQGAYMPWAKEFGRTCPDPDFASASSITTNLRFRRLKRHVHAHPLIAGLGAVAALAALTTALFVLRRPRTPLY